MRIIAVVDPSRQLLQRVHTLASVLNYCHELLGKYATKRTVNTFSLPQKDAAQYLARIKTLLLMQCPLEVNVTPPISCGISITVSPSEFKVGRGRHSVFLGPSLAYEPTGCPSPPSSKQTGRNFTGC